MTLRPGFPAVSRAATQFDIRAALRATTAQDANGTIKTGVSITANSLAGLVTPGQGMNSNIAKFDAILDRYGPIFLSNDGTITIKHDPAPSANSRIDLITVKQHETATPASDPTDGPQITIIKGTPAVDPTTPATPEGALALASVLIPATATSMASDGVIYTQLYPFTAAAGADLLFRTKTEMDKWTPWDGQKAKLLTDDTEYAGSDGAWVSLTQSIEWTSNAGGWSVSAKSIGTRRYVSARRTFQGSTAQFYTQIAVDFPFTAPFSQLITAYGAVGAALVADGYAEFSGRRLSVGFHGYGNSVTVSAAGWIYAI